MAIGDVDPAITSGYVRFANGVHGYNTAGTGPEFEVCGSEGKIRILNNSRECQFRKKSQTFFEEDRSQTYLAPPEQ